MSSDHDAIWADLLQDALDGALRPAELTRFKAHLNECRQCATDYDRLRLLDARLQRDIGSAQLSPSTSFDKQVLAHVARIEAEQRARARQREQQVYAAHLAQLKQSLRFNLASWVAGLATIGAAFMALDFGPVARFLREWYSLANPAWVVAGALIVAAASIFVARGLDRR